LTLRLAQVLGFSLLLLLIPGSVRSQNDTDEHPLSGIPLRLIGPALTSGRVADFGVHPERPEVVYVAMASGGLWKTDNGGTTWTSIFDHEGAYALGTVVLDPHNPDTVWVGSGENNGQRSVGYGDGVYKSLDGGKTWANMGLATSGHVSMIRFHPDDRNVVFVAAQGPLWSPGGDRGLYKSSDGGQSWEQLLFIDENTGVNEFLIHPDNPDVIVASSWQRRRHVWTLINGGPGSGIHKSTDGGASWRKISGGLPSGDLGRIGLAAAANEPGTVYAIIEAAEEDQGVYRSQDFGESWEKRSPHMTTSPQYYNELVVDPNDADVVYSLDTLTNRSIDGGVTWSQLGVQYRHVDDHALWIDPADSEHMYIGGDGGMYETWDWGENWSHVQNLPATQFYRVTPDNDSPFYNVCGGTQDNQTLCGPIRNRYEDGITNADWWIAKFGDGYKAQFDPIDPNIVYAQAQYGNLVRFDKITGEKLFITPQPGADENQYKWNWNTPIIVSPHDHQRIYYGAEFLFRSDDRGESWVKVSPDLTRQIDRNQLEVMGRVWSVDAIAKNDATSMYGAMIALDESPLIEGLIYVGTDDGLIHVTQDGGQNWSRVDSFKGVPDMSLVEDIIASRHDSNVAYAAIDNHKRGDDKPYVLKTIDQGKTWTLISGDLPARGTAHTLAEDHVDPNLLFVGTEFGLFFTTNGGGNWHQFTDLPTIAVRDLEIQRRESDLVVGTFGRGIYVLDDFSPLRMSSGLYESRATLFPVRESWLFIPDERHGWGGLGDYGAAKYSAANPPHGVVVSYYLNESLQTQREQRREAERERASGGGDNPYPSWEALKTEDREEAPTLTITVRDAGGAVVRRIDAPKEKGFHRVAWDLRYPAPHPIQLEPPEWLAPWVSPPEGPLALPGEYQVSLSRRLQGEWQDLAGPESVTVKPMFTGGLVTTNREALLEFQQQTAELYRAVTGANKAVAEIQARIDHLRAAIGETPGATEVQAQELRALNSRLQEVSVALNGDTSVTSRNEPAPMSITTRISTIVDGIWNSQSGVTGNFRDSYSIADRSFGKALGELKSIVSDLGALESQLETEGAPWTPGRIPEWN
jgi:photosystem II stability/assembly factor-like uncharacterized protein